MSCYTPQPISVPHVYLLLRPIPICTTGPPLPLLPDYLDIAAYLDIKQLLSQCVILYCLPLLDSFPTLLLTPSLQLILIDSCTCKSFLTLFLQILLLLTKYDTMHLLSHFHGLQIYTCVPMTQS